MAINAKTIRSAAPYLLLFGALLLFFWPVWLLGYSMPRGGGDLWGQLAPVWSYVARHLRQGSFPLWSTQMMAGDPIVGEAQYGLFNPLNFWLFLLGDFPRWVVLVRGLLPLYLAGAGLYTYLRRSDLWHLANGAALVGALSYMFADAFIVHLGHPHFNDAIAWLPWSLLAIDAVVRQRRVVWWASLPIAATVLAGHFQAALYAVVAVALYAGWRLITLDVKATDTRGLAAVGRISGSLIIVALCSVALTMPALLPGLERYPMTERAILQVEPWTGYQWQADMWIDLIAPGFHGRGVEDFWAPWARVEGGYAGAVALLLAVPGVVLDAFARRGEMHRQRRQRAWFLLGLGTLAVLFALGHSAPLYPLLYKIDLVARMHKTSRAIYLLSFVIALGAAAGVNTLTTMNWKSRIGVCLFFITVALGLLAFAPPWLQAVPADRQANALGSLQLASGLAMITALLVFLHPRRKRAFGPALFVLLLGELILTGTWVEVEAVTSTAVPLAIEYLKSDPNWFRVDVDTAARGLLSPSVVLSYGFDVPQGSGNPMELYSYNQFYWGIATKGSPVYQLLGAKYIIVPSGALPGGDGIWPVFIDDPAVDVHLNTNALPRVWLVYDTIPVSTIEEANAIVFNPSFTPALTATVENGPDLDGAGEGTLEVRWYAPNKVDVLVRSSSEVLMVLSDMDYPGWQASVDGSPVDILKTDGIFRGVIVPAGEHSVTMRYQPASLQLGLGLAAMGALVILLSWTHRQRRISKA